MGVPIVVVFGYETLPKEIKAEIVFPFFVKRFLTLSSITLDGQSAWLLASELCKDYVIAKKQYQSLNSFNKCVKTSSVNATVAISDVFPKITFLQQTASRYNYN